MKFSAFIFTFFSAIVFAQVNENKVLNLLLNNKRVEARQLFNKTLVTQKNTNIDALVIDAMIDAEMGQLAFDEVFTQNFIKIAPDRAYLFPLISQPYFLGDVGKTGFDDNTFVKGDLLGNSKYAEDATVRYMKIILDEMRRKKIDESKIKSVNKWQIAGVFENLNGSGMDTEYEPELYAKNNKLFNANSLGKVNWYNPKNAQKEGYHIFMNEAEYGNGIVYAQSFIEAPEDRTVLLEITGITNYKAFLNDVEIVAKDNTDQESGSFLVKVRLQKGINRLLLKTEVNRNTALILCDIYDENFVRLTDLKYDDTYHDYTKSTTEKVAPQLMKLNFEKYFEKKIAENPNSALNQILLSYGYLNNRQNRNAKKEIDNLLKLYPKSTLVRVMLMNYYEKLKENEKAVEVLKNIETDDPDYYLVDIGKFTQKDFFDNANVKDIEKLSTRLSKTKATPFVYLLNMITALKKADASSMISDLDKFRAASYNNQTYLSSFVSLYDTQPINGRNTIKVLEDFLEKIENPKLAATLVEKYKSANRNDDANAVLLRLINEFPYNNNFRLSLAEQYIKEQKYDQAMNQIDESLANFPYSANALSRKAMLYSTMNKPVEAEKYLRESLTHNSSDAEVMSTLQNITNSTDEINNVATEDLHKLVAARRNTTMKGEKGVTTLLDEYIVNVFPEGGYKKRNTYAFEITSEKGIEELKEYNINYDDFLKKAEVLKKNGSISNGENNKESIVFSNLEVGDVVIVQTESYERTSGRFYKDFNLTSYFNSYYPVVESTFTVITPEKEHFNAKILNGSVNPTSKKINGKKYTTWSLKNLQPIPAEESFSPEYADIATQIKVNTINSWSEIANWYADLVKKVTVSDETTKEAFNEIFPTGISGLTDEQKAEKIYNYIEKNINYSSVDFRQSGFIPQKPSKTIISKLGDCKDVSALFMVLGQQAGLKSNMVLVSTNPNAKNYLAMPIIDFNHCIIKTNLDGKETYLELTDKYLPFKSLITANYKAQALVIGNKLENENATIINLPAENQLLPTISTSSQVSISESGLNVKNVISLFGSGKAYYNEQYSDEVTDQIRKNNAEEMFAENLNKTVVVKSTKAISGRDLTKNPLLLESEFSISEKPQTVGSLNITNIPFVLKSYTNNLVALETRNFDILYPNYETNTDYVEELTLNLPSPLKFTEIPQNSELTYKNHTYELKFELLEPNKLKVSKKNHTPWDTISAAEYPAFKKYVDEVLHLEAQILGYK